MLGSRKGKNIIRTRDKNESSIFIKEHQRYSQDDESKINLKV
jgi:hypothetical protein